MVPDSEFLGGPDEKDPAIYQWPQGQIDTIVIFERLGAAMSVAGVLLIFVAFAASKRLRTVPNTFIVFASIANLGASIACLIGYSGVQKGPTSDLCQAQAFMFELFMQSDPWWSFAMAVNVYMVFFFSANPKSFLRYWWAYFIVCYGIPFIPSLWLLVARNSDGVDVYGDATIWCWIGKNGRDLRIYTYYLPIWVCVGLSTCIYIAVGYYVFKQRNQLRNLSLSNPSPLRDPPGRKDSGEKDLFANAAVMGTINREVVQVTTINSSTEPATAARHAAGPVNWFDGPIEEHFDFDGPTSPATSPNPYHTTVTRITADPMPKEGFFGRIRGGWNRWSGRFANMDPVKLAYLRTSFVFAISVFVTWTPSSINRVHDLLFPGSYSYPLNLASAVVLPLQGTWNAVIFFSTSSVALREEVRSRIDRFRGIPRGQNTADAVRSERERAFELERRITRKAGPRDDAGSELSATTTLAHPGCGSPSASTMRVMRGDSLSSL
ncbi:Uu.00g041280.m01.CDS01 [Anthostomella pinea]|uniref:Uu.00g041280.m01.CDS01 n=1 Tax=Anthostomella pinea TaxID=933095 RepID=A0AAI8VAD1_9PEZI|nr:Uu.00g041280.m01.CDS01 [Anthostomella pinea]